MAENATAARRVLRAGVLLACFGVGLSSVLGAGLSWLRDARLGRPAIVFNYSRLVGTRLPAVAEARSRGETPVAMLGASGLVSYPEGRRVPDRLRERVPHPVVSLGMPGSGPFEYYFLADEIAEAEPGLVVVALNLDHFSRAWQDAYSRPQLAGFVRPGRLIEAFGLPLFSAGLTTDRLLGYFALVQGGGYELWYWLTLRQAQLGRARDQLEAWLQGGHYVARNDTGSDTPERLFRTAVREATIERVFTDAQLSHYREPALRDHYASVLEGLESDHPALRVLGATLGRLQKDGIPVLVYVEPLDLEYVEDQGLLDRVGLARSLEAIATVVEANGGRFAALHDLLPPAGFRDAPGHLAYDDGVDGPSLLADALAPLVEASLLEAGATGPADPGS